MYARPRPAAPLRLAQGRHRRSRYEYRPACAFATRLWNGRLTSDGAAAASRDRVSSISPAPVLQIRLVPLGTPEEVRAPLDHEPVQFAFQGVVSRSIRLLMNPFPLKLRDVLHRTPYPVRALKATSSS